MSNSPNQEIKAIQMIGTQRSGSNLLRVMLNQLPEMYAPHPPHILMVFYPLLPLYGDLADAANFKKLAEDVCTYIEINPVPWENLELDRNKIVAMCRRHTLLELFIKINELQCLHNGKTYWCCKSLETIYYIKNFSHEDFHPFVIYLLRDGRDVAASFKKVMIGEKHIYHLAMKWKNEQELALRYLDTIRHAHDRYIILRYEDFIIEPEKYIMDICSRLGIPYSNSVMNYYSSTESQRTAESGKMWENVTRPVLKNNSQKYLTELSPYEIQLFEGVAGDMLEELGYKRNTLPALQLEITQEQVRIFDTENERLKKLATERASLADIQKRKPQRDFIVALKNKLKGIA